MIKSFKNKETEKIFNRYLSKKYPYEIQRRALLQLRSLHNVGGINDLRNPPSNHLEELSGDRAGQYGNRINDQWRICFTWDGSDAHNVEITDYH
jgi:proteic killer suppression protein